jgi:phage shock protein PspC (stress-responsive transcriptional regulator)
MNKTVNMNLGGIFFHIDENAYQKLNRYFDAIKQSLSNDGREEIMNDIESRIAELFSEKLTNDKQVIGIQEVDKIIAVMGQPEDYKLEDEEPTKGNYTYKTSGSKKLYRDKDTGILGGVSSGLGYYFGIDPVWIRIALVLLVIGGFGTGIVAYIILWIVTPEAKTTSEKLEMRGEPINISNIEKKVREEFGSISDKINNADYDKMGNQVKSSAQKIGNVLSDVFPKLFGAFGKVLGGVIVAWSAVVLISLVVGFFTLGSVSIIDMPWQKYAEAFNYTSIPYWLVGLLGIIAVGVPFFFLFILGLKLLVTNLKSIGNPAKYTLLALWLLSVGILIAFGIRQAVEFSEEGKVIRKEIINLNPNDTLYIKFKDNEYYSKNYHNNDFKFVQDSAGNELIYSDNIRFEVLYTSEKLPYIELEKTAEGKTFFEAKSRAEKIKYLVKIENNNLILDNYFLTEVKDKFRDQEVLIHLYLPEGTYFKPDASVQDYDETDNSFFNLHFSSDNYVYKVQNNQVKCLNCPKDEDEYNDIDNDDEDNMSTNVIINKDGVSIKKDTIISNSNDIKELKINKDGIIIKTN